MPDRYDPKDPVHSRLASLAYDHSEIDGGAQLLDELLLSEREQLLASFRDATLESPDPERWPHRAHEIPARAWKRWLLALDSALDDGNYVLMDYGLVVYLLLEPEKPPRLSLHAYDEYDGGDEPAVTVEAGRQLCEDILRMLEVPMEAVAVASFQLQDQLDKITRQSSYLRTSPPGATQGPLDRLGPRKERLLGQLSECWDVGAPDSPQWPHQPREIDDDSWLEWLENIDQALDEQNRALGREELMVRLELSTKRGPQLALLDIDDEPLRGPVADELARAALEPIKLPAGALETLIGLRGAWLPEACRSLDNVYSED